MRSKQFFKPTITVLLVITSLVVMASTAQAGSKWMRVGWHGDPSSEATITFSPDGTNNNPYVSYGYSTNESSWTTEGLAHTTSWSGGIVNKHVQLTGLNADSEVYFRVCDDNGCGQRFWFRTAPNDNSPFVYVAGGDTRTGWTNRQNGNRLVAKIRPLFVMHGGDFTDDNNGSQWDQWLDDWELTYSNDTINGVAYKRIYPLIGTHGNHEDSDIATICKMLGFDTDRNNSCSAHDTYYGVTISPLLRVYTLNSQFMNESSTLRNAQNNWLSSDLSSNGNSVAWRVAQYHKPMFPHYSGKSDNDILFNWWAQDFYDYGMNLVVESDTHMAKLTEVVAPSGSSFAGSAQGISAGTVYVGEGSWGAPARSANDAKSWTVDMASIQQFKVITVSSDNMEVRTAQFNNTASTLSKSDRDANSTVLPNNVNWWSANGVGEVMELERDGSNRSILAGSGSNGGGSSNGSSVTLSATQDTFIASSQASSNHNGSSDELLADGWDSSYGELQALIKWDLSSIPTCATVESARIQVHVFNKSDGSYNAYAGNNSWSENNATWNAVGGSAHQGNLLGTFNPSSTGLRDILMNAEGISQIQNWVQGSANHGVVIASGGVNDGIDMHDRENGSAPKLLVTYNEDQCSGSGGTVTPTAPNAPSNLNASAASASSITLSWSDQSNDETGFRIERSTDSQNWSTITTTGANSTSYNDTGLAASTTYYYRLRAYNDAGNSSYSNVSNATTQQDSGSGSGSSNALTSGVQVQSSLSSSSDSEIYTIEVPQNASSLVISLDSGSNDFDIFASNLTNNPTHQNHVVEGYTSGGEYVVANNPAAGTWYIKVDAYSGSGAYTLTATVNSDGGSSGGGSSSGNDDALTSGETVTGSMSGTGDEAIYTIQVPAGTSSMRVVLDPAGSSDFDFFASNTNQSPTHDDHVFEGWTGGGEDVTHNNPAAGTWYIRVNVWSGSGSYDLTVTLN